MPRSPSLPRRCLLALALAGALAAAAPPAAPSAMPARVALASPAGRVPSASGPWRPAPGVILRTVPWTVPERSAAAVRSYWTPDRMAAAGAGVAPAVLPQSAGRIRLAAARGAATSANVGGAAWAGGGAVARTTGKVFFSLGGEDFVCSGSAVASPDRSTVLTAGHCVYDPETRTAATNWAFVPGYAAGRAPYGVFAARHLAAAPGWRRSQDFDVDVAFADVAPNARGVRLGDAVGGQPIAFGAARGGVLTAFGYPAAKPWTGERLVHCEGAVRRDTAAQPTGDQGLACSMTPGASGGPWLAGFSQRTGRGTLVSVTSFSYSDRPGVLWGPYLGTAARSLYTAVSSTAGR